MLRGTKCYQHPTLGEVWIAKGSQGYDLLQDKKFSALNTHIENVWRASGMKTPQPGGDKPAKVTP